MKFHQFALLFVVIGSVYATTALPVSSNNANDCSKGPIHWCVNLSNAKKCNAVRHCIQTVWEQQDVPEDKSSVCDVCLEMVKEARDQLQSNETQNDIKAVFEGSCRLIVLKPIVKECIKVADDFIPELIEALASQMNPQVVCSVAGLCNNAKINKMLKESQEVSTSSPVVPELVPTPRPDNQQNHKQKSLSCEQCGYVSSIISTKFKITSRDDMLESVLNLCGHAGSFSDACANIALTYFKTMYEYLVANFDSNAICHMSGTCVAKYHQHPEDVQIQNWSSVGVLSSKDDLPCELCEQLVHHLQEVLTANTTELEFKQVLEGLCRQMGGFKAECLSIVDQYYDQIYQVLVHNLDANGACFLIGVCPKGNAGGFLSQKDIIPLIPYIEPAKINTKVTKLDKSALPVYTNEQINSMQLPIDLLTVKPTLGGNAECTMCEYFLHFLQETLATPSTDEKIKDTVLHLCDKFPNSLRGNCHNFVEMYGDAVIALMIQGFDPRQMCPEMGLCPKNSDIVDVAIITPKPKTEQDKPTCPLCLFSVQQAQELIRDNKSKQNIRTVLDGLCSHLSGKMKNECVDFVNTYSNELVDMLITDFTPQQICVYIKLCTSEITALDWANVDIDDEELIDDLFNNDDSSVELDEENILSPECLLCEKVISEAEKKIGPVKNKDAIEKELYNACSKLKKLADKCHQYIDQYGDKIADLIILETKPKQICKELGYCSWKNMNSEQVQDRASVEIAKKPQQTGIVAPSSCVFCELVIKKLEDQLKDKKTEEEIKHEVENICKIMPKSLAASCDQFIEKYGDLIIALVQTVPPKEICQNLELCPKTSTDEIRITVTPPCLLCELIIDQLEKQLKDNQTADEIKKIVEDVCNVMPQEIADSCDQFIEKYGNLIISLAQSMPPKQICETILICSQKSLEFKKDEPVPCEMCQLVARELENLLKDNSTEQEIIHAVENICTVIPNSLTGDCNKFIEKYGNIIIVLAQSLQPKEICQFIFMCPGIKSKLNQQVIECGVCHGATLRLATYINKEEQLSSQSMIDTVCNDLPAKYYTKCSELLKYYGKSIQNLINRKTEQSKVCAKIGKCFDDENSNLSYVKIL